VRREVCSDIQSRNPTGLKELSRNAGESAVSWWTYQNSRLTTGFSISLIGKVSQALVFLQRSISVVVKQMLVNPAPMTTGTVISIGLLRNGAVDGKTGRAVVTKAYNTSDS
jgi:hypothetical protein